MTFTLCSFIQNSTFSLRFSFFFIFYFFFAVSIKFLFIAVNLFVVFLLLGGTDLKTFGLFQCLLSHKRMYYFILLLFYVDVY